VGKRRWAACVERCPITSCPPSDTLHAQENAPVLACLKVILQLRQQAPSQARQSDLGRSKTADGKAAIELKMNTKEFVNCRPRQRLKSVTASPDKGQNSPHVRRSNAG
jgi:hypothetical protein